jgi:hypothetical protein
MGVVTERELQRSGCWGEAESDNIIATYLSTRDEPRPLSPDSGVAAIVAGATSVGA